ncbi:hypothetical protein HUA78_14430 [Myxococcus sp. CA033]|uniref:hypothetical protein n=1 Tax=Myxococcus sp. CA033 TaxID=2741516 RepID=UPI00157B85E1|nr:hypothetical protein [Myxococcus sp. CA033]NTX35641.1 hypothetical protein [Myxococcus sp. CA033]
MNALRYGRAAGASLCLWATLAAAQQQALTGVYAREGGTLAVLEGDNQTLVQYTSTFPQGQGMGECDCTLAVRKKSVKDWTLSTFQPGGTWTLGLESERLVLKGPGTGCCGAGWSGQDGFSRSSSTALTTCKVKAAQAALKTVDGANGGAALASGDAVQVFAESPPPDVVPVRVVQGKQVRVGQLAYSELDCPVHAGGEASAASGAMDVKALVGRWVQVHRKGKGYVIDQPCGSAIPAVTVKSDGALEVDFGQDSLEGKLTAVKAGAAAGASTLEVAYAGGSRETLQWTVADAKRNVVRLQGGQDFFRKGELYVRDDARKGIPVRAEACDEFE